MICLFFILYFLFLCFFFCLFLCLHFLILLSVCCTCRLSNVRFYFILCAYYRVLAKKGWDLSRFQQGHVIRLDGVLDVGITIEEKIGKIFWFNPRRVCCACKRKKNQDVLKQTYHLIQPDGG